MESTIIAICALIFLIIIMIVFFTKPKQRKVENSLFTALLITNLIGLLTQLAIYYVGSYFPDFSESIIYIYILKNVGYHSLILLCCGNFICMVIQSISEVKE